MKRRHFLASLGAALPLAACDPPTAIEGGFTGPSFERGHLLRAPAAPRAPQQTRRTRVLVLGAGVAGLAAARALRHAGMHDLAVLELEDQAGGNSRATQLGGMACPMGAHYLPVPGDDAPVVQELLQELGLLQRVAGRWAPNERHLCHSPQERLFFRGEWQEGLLPMQDVGAATLGQYRKFSQEVQALRRAAPWQIPVTQQRPRPIQLALDNQPFAAWLDQQGLVDPHLRWYLNYCCRDDYGAPLEQVSAWAGIHYFASRHGFHVPGDSETTSDGVFTWPEGNAWLTQRLAQPLVSQAQLFPGRVVLKVLETKTGVEVDCLHVTTGQAERWLAQRCVVALPAAVGARVLQSPPQWLLERSATIRYAPWAVVNLQLRGPLNDRPGAPPSWDNVVYGGGPQGSLGYVDARHQSLQSVPGPTVLTWYQALGTQAGARQRLLDAPWMQWRDAVLSDLQLPHPDLAQKTGRVEVTRYGHAMPVPWLGSLQQATASLGQWHTASGRIRFAHSDWAGYSVFEEAFTLGHMAGLACLKT